MGFNFRGMFNRGGVLDAASGGTPMDASQPLQAQPNQLPSNFKSMFQNMRNQPSDPNRDAFMRRQTFPEDKSPYDPNTNYMGAGFKPPQQQQPNQGGYGGGFGRGGRFGGGQQSGPWGSAMQGGMNPGQGYFSQNNMGMYQGTPQRPFGMGNNPMMNMMNPYQGNMYGNYGNPNQRQPFMGSGQSPWGQQQNNMQQMYGQAQNFFGGF